MGTETGNDAIQARLRHALRTAVKSKDTVAVSALRSALSAIANAEAVPAQDVSSRSAGAHVAGGTAGLASAEAERRILTAEETAAIVAEEITERQAAARQYEGAGHPDRASRLRHEADVIQSAGQA